MKLIAHRGNDKNNLVENTKMSLVTALDKEYIDGVEFDIRMTKDEKIIVFHDGILNLKTDKKGLVKNKKLKTIKKANLKNKVKINTLEEVLDVINKTTTKKIIMLEVKDEDEKIIDILHNVLKKYTLNFYLISFNNNIINKLKEKYPQYKVGILIAFLLNITHFYNDYDFNIVEYSYYKKISPNKETFIFNVNTKEQKQKIYKHNNKFNIITNKSYLLK